MISKSLRRRNVRIDFRLVNFRSFTTDSDGFEFLLEMIEILKMGLKTSETQPKFAKKSDFAAE